MNLPKNVTPSSLKAQYHKLAKIYHPDMHRNTKHEKKMEARFRQLQEAHEVLKEWVKVRDSVFRERMTKGYKGLKMDKDGTMTSNHGKLVMSASASRQTEEALLLQMIEDDNKVPGSDNLSTCFGTYISHGFELANTSLGDGTENTKSK
eukprot:CAMPEP_0197005296 /NCGR_PEP_ID=MMETSP1380-20130617/28692_1 /TAXON_ID=5936 /ORGANISM="Euplotes crassus, Strain CT5" /LENGTH=148 /DNA_ID=CAMNT_0042424385 /DNA_START=327 /DNA_END=771 /DNA_ORIENTATION=+